MKKICVIHSSADTCAALQRISKKFLLSSHVFHPLIDSNYFDFIYQHQPRWILLEASAYEENNRILEAKMKVLSPSSEIYFITNHIGYSQQVGEQVFLFEEEILQEEVPPHLTDFFNKHMHHENSPYISLTETEMQVLALLMQGNSPRRISVLMKRKYNTIRKHVQHIYEKTGIHHYKSFQVIIPFLFVLMQTTEFFG